MSAIQKISFSKANTWRRCHKMYDYRYNQKLRPKRRSAPLIIGGSVHDCLEAFYKGEDVEKVMKKGEKDFNKLFLEEREKLGDIPAMNRSLVERYIDHWSEADLIPIETEKEFEVEIGDGIVVEGKIDLIATDSADRIWVEEHKTCANMPDDAVRMADQQSIIYGSKIVMEACGFGEAAGVIWDYLRKKIPRIPEMLKNGKGLSKNKSIDTTPEIYMKAITDNGLDPNDYREILEKLEYKDEAFFKRIRLPLSEHLTEVTFRDMLAVGQQIREFGKKWQDRSMGKMTCGYCDYFSLCQAEVRGAPDDYIRTHDYMISDGRPKNGSSKKENGSKEEDGTKKVKRRLRKDTSSTRATPRVKRTPVRKKRNG